MDVFFFNYPAVAAVQKNLYVKKVVTLVMVDSGMHEVHQGSCFPLFSSCRNFLLALMCSNSYSLADASILLT
jgi:hypothetical protein